MIAQWIAQAMLRGDDHLTLSTKELVEWQLSGCRVSLGMPRNSLGMYVEMHIRRSRGTLRDCLISQNPLEWAVGKGYIGEPNKGLSVYVPNLDFESAPDGKWRVPLIPPDPNHSLDAWADDITLAPQELHALKPLAGQLLMRMLLRCEFKTTCENVNSRHQCWRDGRLAVADLAGYGLAELSLLFCGADPYTSTPPPNGDTVFRDEYQSELRRIRRVSAVQYCPKPRTYLKPMKIISSTPNFIQEVSVLPIDALSDFYHLQFASRLLTAKNPKEQRPNFDLILDRRGLEAMNAVIDEALKA